MTKPREKPTLTILERRDKTYQFRTKVNRIRDPLTGREQWRDDPGGRGWEIAREGLVCSSCTAAVPEVVQ